MVIFGLTLIGCAFGAALFSINADYGDKRAWKIVVCFLIGVVMSAIALVVTANREMKQPIYRYRVTAYFLEGSSKEFIITSRVEPRVGAYNGTYWLDTGNGRVLGVVRCEIRNRTEVEQTNK